MKKWKRVEPTIVSKIGHRSVISKAFKLPNGKTKNFETNYDEQSQAVAILALTTGNMAIVCRQFRPGPEMLMDELPGGYVDDGEALDSAARRELLEETGFKPGKLTHLGVMHYSAYDNLEWHCFLAVDCELSEEEASLDGTEFVELRFITIEELLANARAGKMTDPGAVLLAYEELQKRKGKK